MAEVWTGFKNPVTPWATGAVSNPSTVFVSAPTMFLPTDGADAAILRPVCVGSFGGQSVLWSIYGVTRSRSTNAAFNARLPESDSNLPYVDEYVCQSIVSYATLDVSTLSIAAYGKTLVNYYQTLGAETVGAVITARDQGLTADADSIGVLSPGAGGIAEVALGNIGSFHGLAFSLAVLQLAGVVTEFNVLANLRIRRD